MKNMELMNELKEGQREYKAKQEAAQQQKEAYDTRNKIKMLENEIIKVKSKKPSKKKKVLSNIMFTILIGLMGWACLVMLLQFIQVVHTAICPHI